MFSKQYKSVIFFAYAIAFVCAGFFAFILGYDLTSGVKSFSFVFVSSLVIFTLASIVLGKFSDAYLNFLRQKILNSGETAILNDFVHHIKFSYSIDELIKLFQNILENQADCSVLLIDRKKKYVIYNSPTALACDEKTFNTIQRNFSRNWKDGYYFFDKNFGLVSKVEKSRGFFIVFEDMLLFIFCNYTKLFDRMVLSLLFDELVNFNRRSKIISELTKIDELSQEWAMVAETQRSFLPTILPHVRHLDMAEYFRPLVNVSGDYYTTIPLTEDKTLVLLGDVSGKGLAAALLMGIVINTVKNIENKNDLLKMVRAIDKAIKGMHLEDKYTVLFVGIIDTQKMQLSFINASMSDPLILTKIADTYKIKRLASNCSLIGLIDLGDVEVSTIPLFWNDLILIASDGISEIMDDKGVELGNTALYLNTIKTSASKTARHFVEDVKDLALSYNGDKKLRDDITMLVIKVEE